MEAILTRVEGLTTGHFMLFQQIRSLKQDAQSFFDWARKEWNYRNDLIDVFRGEAESVDQKAARTAFSNVAATFEPLLSTKIDANDGVIFAALNKVQVNCSPEDLQCVCASLKWFQDCRKKGSQNAASRLLEDVRALLVYTAKFVVDLTQPDLRKALQWENSTREVTKTFEEVIGIQSRITLLLEFNEQLKEKEEHCQLLDLV